jgi:TolB protein
MLSTAVDEAFDELRERIAREAGWDFLARLDNAYAGLNDPLPPGFQFNDWLYTGRAFAFSEAVREAGWLEVVREDFSGLTYWRVYVRASIQDGSLGEPLRTHPWDFRGLSLASPLAYDQGGSLKSDIPQGYYVDFTLLAEDFGFDRLPSLANWRTYLPGTRYNEFVLSDGLTWEEAMLEIYPASAIITPTPFRTPTPTATRTPWPTPTPWWWRLLTPSPSPTFPSIATPAP